MSKPTEWQDRRGMFQSGKEVHAPSSPSARKFFETGTDRRASASSATESGGGLEKTLSGSNAAGAAAGGAASGGAGAASYPTASWRRRSSAASGGGLFGNLTHQKRGSQDYGARRASQLDMQGQGGMVSGWFNKTFKGMDGPKTQAEPENK